MNHVDNDDTKTALLKAGVKFFSENGYEGVSVRTLAKEVGANVAAVGYHFGGKQEFYLAVAGFVVAQVSPKMIPLRQRLLDLVGKPDFDPHLERAAIEDFVSDFIEKLLLDDLPQGCHAFVLREYANPGKGFDVLYAGVMEPMHQVVTKLYARIRGLDPETPAAIIGAHSLLGQWLFFRVAEQAIFRRLNWSRFEEAEIAQVKAVVVPSVMRSLGLDD